MQSDAQRPGSDSGRPDRRERLRGTPPPPTAGSRLDAPAKEQAQPDAGTRVEGAPRPGDVAAGGTSTGSPQAPTGAPQGPGQGAVPPQGPGQGGVPPQGHDPDGPPAPPLPPRVPADDQTPRSTAATWVAATGALLLLVAAGIFLAVSWDVLGLTARVAVVASITAAAIVGGHRLRQILPAVGAVLFHLGALLLPVDALGLALQLDLSTASAWILTGAVTLLALPPLAIAGKSRVLATAAVVGAPVLATGLGLAGIIDPSLAVALFAVASLASLRLRGTRVARIWRGAPVALAMTAVLLPLIAAALDATLAEGQIVAAIQAAGWGPSSWVVPVIVGVLAVAADAIAAKALHSRPLAAIAPILAAVSAVVAVIPEGTPRLALLLVGPVFFLLVEALATLTQGDDDVAVPMRWTASTVEVVAAFGALVAAQLVVAPSILIGTGADPELAVAMAVAGVAFAAAVVRHRLPGGPLGALPILLGGAAILHGIAAATVAIGGDRTALAASLLLAVVGIGLIPALTSGREEAGTSRNAAPARVGVATVLAVLACAAAWNTPMALPIALLAAPLVGLHLRATIVAGHDLASGMAGMAAPIVALASLLLAGVEGDAGPTSGLFALEGLEAFVLQVGVATVAVLALAATIDRVPVVADIVRGLGVAVVLLAGSTMDIPATLAREVVGDAQIVALELMRPIPALLVVLAPVAVWLVLDGVRLGRTAIAVMAAPVVVRLAATVVAGFGAGPAVLGGVLLAFGLLALVASLTTRDVALRASLIVTAVLSVAPGWALVGITPEARAIALIAIGLTGAAVGVVRRNLVVGHAGGAVAILGIWLLLDLRAITEIDLWILPVAIQLAIAGHRARRAGTVSSWAIDVPPMLLVAVAALGERLAGGPGWHGVLAGTVAIIAVIYGGAAGRGGPLTSGIVVLLTVVIVETVAYAALVPTWAWFAVAGSALIGAAVLIERKGLSPTRAVGTLKRIATDEPTDRHEDARLGVTQPAPDAIPPDPGGEGSPQAPGGYGSPPPPG
jgi:hypothetical protein